MAKEVGPARVDVVRCALRAIMERTVQGAQRRARCIEAGRAALAESKARDDLSMADIKFLLTTILQLICGHRVSAFYASADAVTICQLREAVEDHDFYRLAMCWLHNLALEQKDAPLDAVPGLAATVTAMMVDVDRFCSREEELEEELKDMEAVDVILEQMNAGDVADVGVDEHGL